VRRAQQAFLAEAEPLPDRPAACVVRRDPDLDAPERPWPEGLVGHRAHGAGPPKNSIRPSRSGPSLPTDVRRIAAAS